MGRLAIDDLERALIHAPDDLELWQVFADHLTSVGDPRGELIALSGRHDPETLEKIAKVLRENRESWLDGISEEAAKVSWRFGFIDGATLDVRSLPDHLRASLLDLPSARFLRRLTIFGARGTGFDPDLAALASRPRAVRELTLTSRACEVPSLARTLQALPLLRALQITGRASDDVLEHQRLQTLSLFLTRRPNSYALRLPALQRLTLSVRQIAPTDFVNVIDGLDTLRELHVKGRADAFCADLVRSPRIARLKTLCIHKCGELTARAVLSRRATLTQIEFKLRRPAITRELYEELLNAGIDVAMWNPADLRNPQVHDREFDAHENGLE